MAFPRPGFRSLRRPTAFRAVILVILALFLAGCQPLSKTQAPPPAPTRAITPLSPAPTAPLSIPRPSATPTRLPQPVPPTAPSTCAQTGGRVERRQLDAPNLPRPLQVRVYLPPCYSASTGPYPLLLLLHGQAADSGQWESLGLVQVADRLIAQQRISPLVIALPQEDDNLANPFESGFGLALVDDLPPWLRQEYAVCPERGCTAIGGLSRGAAWAVFLGLSYPEVFGAVGAHSFPSFYGDEARLPLLLREIPPGRLPGIWMDIGEHDRYVAQATRYHELLDQYGAPHEWHLFPGEHDAAYWSAHLEEYLSWYSPATANP